MNTILEFRKYFLVENAPNFFTKQDIFAYFTKRSEEEILILNNSNAKKIDAIFITCA